MLKTKNPPNLDANKPPKILFIKYPIKKDDNIIAFLMAHINFMIAFYSSFELHINLDKFVLSDFHHHQQLIKDICH